MPTNTSIALLLEDEPLIAMSIEDELESAGFSVSTAMSCEQATAWLDTNVPDVVIVDITLRDGSWSGVVSRLITAKIPFVVHSGDHPSVHEGTVFARGVWVNKPAGTDELAMAARGVLVADG